MPLGGAGRIPSRALLRLGGTEPRGAGGLASLVEQSGYYTTEESPVGTWFVETQPGPPGAEGFLLTDEWVVIADTREMVPDVLWTR